MDPDATLTELRERIKQVCLEYVSESLAFPDIAALFQDLDTYLCKGGFLPHDWDRRGNDLQ